MGVFVIQYNICYHVPLVLSISGIVNRVYRFQWLEERNDFVVRIYLLPGFLDDGRDHLHRDRGGLIRVNYSIENAHYRRYERSRGPPTAATLAAFAAGAEELGCLRLCAHEFVPQTLHGGGPVGIHAIRLDKRDTQDFQRLLPHKHEFLSLVLGDRRLPRDNYNEMNDVEQPFPESVPVRSCDRIGAAADTTGSLTATGVAAATRNKQIV